MTTIEVVMPFYGDVHLLHEAVRSVVAQDDDHWRLVVLDDAHPSRTVEAWFAEIEDPRVRYRRNDTNLGLNANFRRALDLARGDWVVLMGCDDLMLPGYVRRVRELVAAHPGAAVLQPGVLVVDQHGDAVRPLPDLVKQVLRPRARTTDTSGAELGGEALARSLLRGNWTYFPSLCWRREPASAHGFRRDLDVVLDLALLLDVVVDGGTLVLDDQPVFGYRRHAASASMQGAAAGSRFEEERTFFLQTATALRARGWASAARVAERHLSSRMNAASGIPSVLRAGEWDTAARLARHVAGRPGRSGTPAAEWEHRA